MADTNIAQDKSDKQLHKERQEYLNREYGSLVGKTIKAIRPMTRGECDDLMWEYGYEREACVVIFTDGTAVVPMADPEGNSPGFLAIGELS
jgi:hypothetical protein